MTRLSRRSLSRSAIAAYLCICVALALLLSLSFWGTYQDLGELRQMLLRAEVGRLRSHAERTVGRIERDLETADVDTLSALDELVWLSRHWEQFAQDEANMYAAIVDTDGRIWRHSSASQAGRRLPEQWYDRVLHELGDEVVQTHSDVLTLGEEAYDVRLPIVVDGEQLGGYHVGLDMKALQQRLGMQRREFLQRRALLMGGVLLVVLLATTSLFYIATHSITLRRKVDSTSLERTTEVGALAAGLAHEIRNPLHAIQLNLHTLRRAQQRGMVISAEEMTTILDESTNEIDRIDQLMQQLVNFTTPEQPRDETINLVTEIRSVVNFLEQELLSGNIQVQLQMPSVPVTVRMDHGRLRQVMLNLLQNAQQAMPDGGRVRVALQRTRKRAEMTVADNGPGVLSGERERIFEPFYSTKDGGTGLGLALVRRFVEEVGGDIRIQDSDGGGATFRISLPIARDRKATG